MTDDTQETKQRSTSEKTWSSLIYTYKHTESAESQSAISIYNTHIVSQFASEYQPKLMDIK